MKKTLLTILGILGFMILVSSDACTSKSAQNKQGISVVYSQDTSKLSIQEKNQIIIIQNQEEIIKNQQNLMNNQKNELTNQGNVLTNQKSMLNNQRKVLDNHDSMLNNQERVFKNQGTELKNEEIILKKQDSIKDGLTDSTKTVIKKMKQLK